MTSVVRVTSGNASLAAVVEGPAHLPWLILSNSLATDMSLWDDQMPAVSAIRRVLRYDTRGHGKSSAPPGPYSFDDLVGDVIALMDHFWIETADVLGLSMGGMTALGLGLEHPHRIRSLVCANARAVFPPAGIASWDQRAAAVAQGGIDAIVDDTIARWFTANSRETRPELVERARRMILSTAPDGYRACTAALKRLDYLHRLGALSMPALFIAGEADAAAPPDAMQEMANAAQDGRFAILSAVAHISNMEDTAGFTAAVSAFLVGNAS
jgi:3-oxoadipate enol-lactonase